MIMGRCNTCQAYPILLEIKGAQMIIEQFGNVCQVKLNTCSQKTTADGYKGYVRYRLFFLQYLKIAKMAIAIYILGYCPVEKATSFQLSKTNKISPISRSDGCVYPLKPIELMG